MPQIMVHLNHPCREIDVWVIDRPEDYIVGLKQGYLPLEAIRLLVYDAHDIDQVVKEMIEEAT